MSSRGNLLTRRDEIILGFYFPLIKKEYTGSDILYEGFNVNHDAADTDTNWTIIKYTWDSGITQQETLVGAWDDRATLSWL